MNENTNNLQQNQDCIADDALVQEISISIIQQNIQAYLELAK